MLLLILLGLGLIEAQQPEKLVSALDPVIVETPDGRRTVEVDLTNKANQDVTYWMVSIRYMLSNGDVEHRGHGRDLYPAYSRSRPDSERDRVIPARGTVRAVIDLGQTEGLSVISVRTEIEEAVFADGSWFGDPASVQDVFARRDRDARALAFVLASLKDGAASASGLDAVRVALQRLERKWPNDPDEGWTRTMRRNLQWVIDGTIKTSPDEFMEHWIPQIEAAWRVADTHRRAKPGFPIKDRFN
jgi:hypothetical protein